MSEETSVEAAGETVGEAKWAAIRELERLVPSLDRDAVQFQVVTEGERGLLGVGYTPARVVATVTHDPESPSPEADESAQAAEVRKLLSLTAAAFDVDAMVRLDEDDEQITATISGHDVGVLIGRRGQTIDALQYLANAISYREEGELRRRVVIDASGYRARRTEAVETLARRSAERAAATGYRVPLEPMTAVERKIVHEALKDDPEVETTSEGTEPNRHVVVIPRHSAI